MAFIIGGGITIGPGISFIDGSEAPAANDPYFEYVVTLLSGAGTNNATNNTFVDSSTNNFSITRFGNATQGTFAPYGSSWSNYFDGTGDYLTLPTTSGVFNFGTGDFTIETWIFPTALGGYKQIAGSTYGTTGGALYLLDGTVTVYTNGVNAQTPANSVVLNTWQHIAAVRTSGTLKIYINGVQSSSASFTNNLTTANGAIGGRTAAPTQENYSGYFSNLRVVKAAVYSANFTPSTAPLTAIANTSLLTCQSNRFIDNSANNFAITRFGDTKVERFNPFGLTTAYTPQEFGGSIYCDGNGDYLSVPYNAVLSQSTAYTLEMWFYPTSTVTSQYLYARNAGGYFCIAWTGTVLKVDRHGVGIRISGTTTLAINAWHHVAMTYDGTTTRLFADGILQGSVTETGGEASGATTVGYYGGNPSSSFYGYISNLSLIKGSAIYTTDFTPPTAPVTAVAGTALLLNGTNAGIYDSAIQENFETFGDAKISTAVSKWDTGSMAFDGTGDYVSSPTSPIYSFGTGDFTVESWVYFSALGADRTIADCWVTGTAGSWQLNYLLSSTKFTWLVNTTTVVSSTTTPLINTWYHVAVARSGSTVRIFVNGTLEASATLTTNLTHTRPLTLGMQYSTVTKPMNGYLNDFRITNGIARYTANFTPPSAALPLY